MTRKTTIGKSINPFREIFHFIRRYFLFIIIVLVLPQAVFSQAKNKSKFVVFGKFIIKKGNYNNSSIVVVKNGQKVMTIPGDSKYEFELDYQAKYIISFMKDGYITKKISVNTTVPTEIQAEGLKPYEVSVAIFQQYEGVNTVIFNQPVGKIYYNATIDDIALDTDYTKSIQDELNAAEKLADQKGEDESKKMEDTKAKAKAEEETRKKAEAEAKAQAQATAEKAKIEAEAKAKTAEEAKEKALEEAKEKAKVEAEKVKAEAEAREKAAQEAKAKAEEESKKKAAEQARMQAEADAKAQAAEEAKKKAAEAQEAIKKAMAQSDEAAKKKAEEEARLAAEAKKKADEEAKKAEQEKNNAAYEALLAEVANKKAAQAAEEEAKRKQMSLQAAEAKKIADEKAAEEAKKKAQAIAAADEARRKSVAEYELAEAKKKAAQEAAISEARRKAAEAAAADDARRKEAAANYSLGMDLLSEKYPESRTVETIEDPYKKTTRIVIKLEKKVVFYRKVEFKWGGIYYFKDSQNISEPVFTIESQ